MALPLWLYQVTGRDWLQAKPTPSITAPAEAIPSKSIAVLPFQNLSND